MSEKDITMPASDEAVDAILAEVLGKDGSHLAKRYSADGTSVPMPPAKEEPVIPQPEPSVSAPKNTATASEVNPDLLEADYRAAAAKYEVNGYRFSAPQSPAYAPYPAYPSYPAYPQPVAYVPYPAYPAYPAYPQAYGYPAYPTGYEGYAEYPQEQQQPTTQQQQPQNAYAAAAGSRVVYDADWSEPGSRQTAQQPQQPAVPVMQAAQSGKPHVNPAFIDPLSSYDDDETAPAIYTESVSFADRHKSKNPQAEQTKQGTDFFPAGFSATKNDVAAIGKTTPAFSAVTDPEQNIFEGFSDDYEKTKNRQQEWLLTDEELLEIREQRTKKKQQALTEAAAEVAEPVYETASAEQEEERQRIAEAQQIIAEQFSQQTNTEKSRFQAEPHHEAPQVVTTDVVETIDFNELYGQADANSDNETNDLWFDDQYSNKENKGVSELYYNNPNNEPEATERPAAKEKTTNKKQNKFTAFIRRNTPHKGQTPREFISCLIMDLAFVILIGGLIFCGIYFKNFNDEKDQQEQIKLDIYEEDIANKLTNVQLDQLWADLKAAYPDIDYPENLNPDFAKLYTVNQDVAGWVTIEGTDVSTVILQADNNDYYLYRDLYKESTKYGTPFVDYRNSMDSANLSRNTIIYGHNTHDGLLFHNLTRYLELSGYKAGPLVKMNTLFSGMTYWKIFAVTLSDSTTDEFEYLYDTFSSEDAFMDLVDSIRAHSMYDIDVDVKEGDNILTLYTCYQNLFEGGRLTIFARQVRAGEDLTVNTANATVNSDCLYPDAYYGITYENSTYTTDSGNDESNASSDSWGTAAGDDEANNTASDDSGYEYDYEYDNDTEGEESLG